MPAHDLIARFAGDLAQLWPEESRLALAVSGGADSLALLLLARSALPGRFEVASVDHGLRPEATRECAMVAELCAAHAIPHEILTVRVGSGNMLDQARAARYSALTAWMGRRGLPALLTAHHADDQAETLIMRLNRGSGVAGLAGVRMRGTVPGTDLPLLRPLLAWRRADLAELVRLAGLEPVLDPGNEDPHYDRARIRQGLREADWINPQGLAASAVNLADAEAVMIWATNREWEERVRVEEGEIHYSPAAPPAIRLRVLARAIALLGGQPRGGGVARLLARLQNGKDATLAGVVARVGKNGWTLRKEPPRRAGGMN